MALEKHGSTFEARVDDPKLTAMPPSLRKRKRDEDGMVDDILNFRRIRLQTWNVFPNIASNLNYLDQLSKFHKLNGINLNRFPSVDKRPLDLYKLKKAVEVRGGFGEVCKLKKWAQVGRDVGYSGKIVSSLRTSLKNSYLKWLLPYEEFLRVAKPGVQHQIDYENGAGYGT